MSDSERVVTRRLGGIAVDSGSVVIGDPGLLLPHAAQGKQGIDYQAVIDAPSGVPAQLLADLPVQLIDGFGGDGDFPIYGEFVGDELVAITVRFDEDLDADD